MIETLVQLFAFLWLVGVAIGVVAGLLAGLGIIVFTVVDVLRASRRYD